MGYVTVILLFSKSHPAVSEGLNAATRFCRVKQKGFWKDVLSFGAALFSVAAKYFPNKYFALYYLPHYDKHFPNNHEEIL